MGQCDIQTSILIRQVMAGRPRPLARGVDSAIFKEPVDGPVRIGPLGIDVDQQADRAVHGGPEMAVHHYPFEHYAVWAAELVDQDALGTIQDLLSRPGAFGENISTLGLTEAEACIGDRWRAGSVLLEISQARQPCWKLNERFKTKELAARVQSTGRSGWYYRVREGGIVKAGDDLELLDRPQPDWPLSRVLKVLYRDTMNRQALEGLAALAPLSAQWRALAQRRLDSNTVEDWQMRLMGV